MGPTATAAALGAALLLAASGAAAADLERCYGLMDQRDQRGGEAMAAEISLARRYRDRQCPALSRQAEAANALTGTFAPLDYEALIACRHRAEQQLERDNPVLFRNSLGFTFYTPRGAQQARQADALLRQLDALGCRP